MDMTQLRQRAREVRALYADQEERRYGRSWTTEEVMLGFLGDVGDLESLFLTTMDVLEEHLRA
jgi:hypothetical protein